MIVSVLSQLSQMISFIKQVKMGNIKKQLEQLSEDSQGNVNYDSWIFKLTLTLKSKDLYSVATGVTVKPEG